MAWNDAWDADTVYIGGHDFVLGEDLPSVKHLLADLCNAINERRKYYLDFKIAWKIADGTTSTDPVPNDFRGMKLNSNQDPLDGHVLPEVLIQLLGGIDSCLTNTTVADSGISLKDTGYFTDATYTTRWTWDTLLADVGLLDYGEVINLNNWRSPLWWLTLRGVVERLRYLEIQAGMERGGGVAVYTGPETYPYETEVRDELWTIEGDTVTDIDVGSTFPSWVGYNFVVRILTSATPPTSYVSAGFKAVGEFFAFIKATSFPVEWDTDYNQAINEVFGEPPAYVLGSARTYPPPKAAHNGKLLIRVELGRRDTRVGYLGELLNGASITWKDEEEDEEAATPDVSEMLLELGFAGASFTKAGDNANVWVEITASPDGVDDFTATFDTTMPVSVPEAGYEPDDGYDERLDVVGQFWATMKQINAQFDLNSEYTYPA